MNLSNVDNCPRCGKIYIKGFREVCEACARESEDEFQRCSDYLREHRGTNLQELHEATGTTISQITKYIREGRISVGELPNLSYPCDSCGTLIRSKTLCDTCRARLTRDVGNMREDESLRRRNQTGSDTPTYGIRNRKN